MIVTRTLLFLTVLSMMLPHGLAWGEKMTLEDRALIADQVAKYAQVWDRKDAEAFVQLFTDTGEIAWEIAGSDDTLPVIKGHEALLEYARYAHEGRLAGKQSRHHFSSLVFEHLSATEALTEHTFLVTHVTPGEQPIVAASGFYRIAWEKTDQGWLMSHRTLHVDR